QAIERPEKRAPFPAQWIEPPLPRRRQRVIPAVATCAVPLPMPFYPASFFKRIQHGIQGSEIESQGAAGLFLDLFGNFEPVKRASCQKREDGNLGAAAG